MRDRQGLNSLPPVGGMSRIGGAANRGDVCWYTRDSAIPVLICVTIAPITSIIRSIPTEVVLTVLADGNFFAPGREFRRIRINRFGWLHLATDRVYELILFLVMTVLFRSIAAPLAGGPIWRAFREVSGGVFSEACAWELRSGIVVGYVFQGTRALEGSLEGGVPAVPHDSGYPHVLVVLGARWPPPYSPRGFARERNKTPRAGDLAHASGADQRSLG